MAGPAMIAVDHFGVRWIAAAGGVSAGLTALVATAVATGMADRADRAALALLRLRQPPGPNGKPKRLTTALRDLTALGGDTLRILFLVACMAALGADDRGRVAIALLVIFAVARGALFALKALVRRPRPPADGETIVTYTTSFPSGHTFMAGVLYLSAALLIPEGALTPLLQSAVAAALALSFAVGLTRVSFGIHWLSDMLAGWLAAIAWTAGCVLLLDRLHILP